MYLFSDENGKIIPQAPKIDFLDHGFLFGDSIYEVVRLYQGKVFGWNEHIDRLLASARRLGIEIETRTGELRQRAKELFQEFGEPDACLRMIITRGSGKLHIDPRTCKEPRIYMAAWKYDAAYCPDSMRLYIPKVRRNLKETMDPGIKSGNYLNSIMAFREAIEAGYEDALMLNPRDELTELTTSNIAWIRNSKLETPSTQCGILYGVTRHFLLQTMEVREASYGTEVLNEAEEVFALSTLKELVPVSEIRTHDGRSWKWSRFDQTLLIREKLRHTIEKELNSQENWI